jgi:hypothetical protein
MCFHQLWCKLESLEQFVFDGDVAWHVDRLRKALICVSPLIDEQLCRSFELPLVTTKKDRLHTDAADYAQER